MCEEDRKAAVTMFEKVFDDAPDEQAAIAHLGSPTRQAVALARVYDFKEREREIQDTKSGRTVYSADNTPAFMEVIDDTYRSVLSLEPERTSVHENQISFFQEDGKPQKEEKEIESTPDILNEAGKEPLNEPASVKDDICNKPHDTVKKRRRPAWKDPLPEETAEYNLPVAGVSEADNNVVRPADISTAVDVDSFVRTMKVEDEISAAEESESNDDSILDSDFYEIADTSQEENETEECSAESIETQEDENGASVEAKATKTVRKQSVPLLVLYILLAIPVTAMIITLLLVVAAVVLAIAVFLLWIAVTLISSAFGGFAVFADIMVVLGTALVLFALGILTLWTGIWIIGGAVVGTIKTAIRLGGKVSSKEVSVNE